MIQMETILNCTDNSGAKEVKCIKTYSRKKKKYSKLGELISVSIQSIKHKRKLVKSEIKYGIIVRTKYPLNRHDGTVIKFSRNEVVLINSKTNYQPIGTRIFGPIPMELKYKGLYKNLFIGCQFI